MTPLLGELVRGLASGIGAQHLFARYYALRTVTVLCALCVGLLAPALSDTRPGPLLQGDEPGTVFGITPTSDNTAPHLRIRGENTALLSLRLTKVAAADTEVRASFKIFHVAVSDGPPLERIVDVVPGARLRGSVQRERIAQGDTNVVYNRYTFSVVFPAGQKEITALRITLSEQWLALAREGEAPRLLESKVSLVSVPNFPLTVVEDADEEALGLVNSFTLELLPPRSDSIKLPSAVALVSTPVRRADEGSVLGYDIVAAVGMSVRVRLNAPPQAPHGLHDSYEGSELVWSVDADPDRARMRRHIDLSKPSGNDLHITFFHSSLPPSAVLAGAICPESPPTQRQLLVPLDTAVGSHRINLELPEDSGDYWGSGSAAMAGWVLQHHIVCVSRTVGNSAGASLISIPCNSAVIADSPTVCTLRHPASGKSTITVTVDDNDARIGRIDFLRNAPPGSPLHLGPATISEPLPGASMPGGLVPADGSTLTVVMRLPGINRGSTPLPLSLRLRALDSYAQRARHGAQILGSTAITLNLSVPAGEMSATDTLSLGIPADEVYHRPGLLRLTDTSGDALDPPESTTVPVLDLGDGYYEFPRDLLDNASLVEGAATLAVRVRLLAPAALETTVRISFDTTINTPPGIPAPGIDDFIARAGVDAIPASLVRSPITGERVRDEVTVRFAAGAREAEPLHIGFGPGFYTGPAGVVADHAVMTIPGALSDLVPADEVLSTDAVTGTARALYTTLSLSSVNVDPTPVVVHASTTSFTEGDDDDALFSISTLSSNGMPIAFSSTWTLQLDLDDLRGVLRDGSVRVAPPSVSIATRPGGAPGRSALILTVPANTLAPITVGAGFVPGNDGVLHGMRPVSLSLRTATDAANLLSIIAGHSSATVHVVDANRVAMALLYEPGQASFIAEGEQTALSILLTGSDDPGGTFEAHPGNPAPIVVAAFVSAHDNDPTRPIRYGGACAHPAPSSDYCTGLGPGAELAPGVRWEFMTPGDDTPEYPVLRMDPGSTVQVAQHSNVITLHALKDAVLEGDELLSVFTIEELRFAGLHPDDVPLLSRSNIQPFGIAGIADPDMLHERHRGELFYSVRPLVLTEGATSSTTWTVALVNAAGVTYRHNLHVADLPAFGLDSTSTLLQRAISPAALLALAPSPPRRFLDAVSTSSVEPMAVFSLDFSAPAQDADAINELGFFELRQFVGDVPVGDAVPPHSVLGFEGGMPALRVHLHDDDALPAVELQRYERAGDGTTVPAPGFGLDGTQIQGAAAFVSATVTASNPLHAARRRSSFGVVFAPGRDPERPPPFESASHPLRTGEGSYHYVLLALSIGSTGSTSFDYQTTDADGMRGSNSAGFASEFMELRIGQWANGRITPAPRNYRGSAGEAQLLLLTNDPDFLTGAPADAASGRAELRRICPPLAEAGLTSTATGSLAVADGSRYNAAAFHLLDVRRDGAYYGFREDAASVEVELLCASDPSLSPDLSDNSRGDGSMGAEFCATRMAGNRCLLDTSGDQLDYQNYLPGFHDGGTAPLKLSRAHDDALLEPDDARAISRDDPRTRVGVTVQDMELQLHADYGGDTVAFVPRAHRPGAGTDALQLELAWDVAGGADAIAARELELGALVADPASTSSSLLLSLLPTPSGGALELDITVAARPDERYEHCLNHRFFANRDRDLGYLDTGSSTDLHRRTRRNLCRHVDDPALDDAVRTELRARGREPSFRLLSRLHYRALGAGVVDAVQSQPFPGNAFRVRDSDSYARLVVNNTALREGEGSSAVTVQVQFGGNSDTRYGDVADATTLLPVDLALMISGDADRLGMRFSGGGLARPLTVPASTANVDIDIALDDPSAHARSYDPLALRGTWLDTSLPLGANDVRELLLFGEDAAGASTATRYDLTRDHAADPVLGNLISIVRLRGLLPARGLIDVMRISAVDDSVAEGHERFAVQLGILSATQSQGTDSVSNRRTHSQRASGVGKLDDVLVDTSQGIEQDYSAAFDELRANGRSVRTAATIEIRDDEMPDIIVRDNTATAVFLENDLPRNAQEAMGVDTGRFPLDPEGDDYRATLTRIAALGLAPNGSGALLRIDLASPTGRNRLPGGQTYQVLYDYTTPVAHTVHHELDLRAGDALYLLLGDPALVEAGGACAQRVTDLGSAGKPLVAVAEHPAVGTATVTILDALPDAGLGARLFFSVQDAGSRRFHGEGAFNYSVTLLCSDNALFDPDNPATEPVNNFCVSGGANPNWVDDDPVDGGTACSVHRSRDYVVRDANHALAVEVRLPGGARRNFPDPLALSLDEPDAARPAISRSAIRALRDVTVAVGLRHRIYGDGVLNASGAPLALVLPDTADIFQAPFAGREGGAPFAVTPIGTAARINDGEEYYTWFRFSTLANDHLDGVDRVVELSLALDVLPTMRTRVVHANIPPALGDMPPGYTPLVIGAEFSATLRLSDSDNYYHYLGSDPAGLRLRERADDSTARPVMVAFGATALGQAILDADPLAGERLGMRIARARATTDTLTSPSPLAPATLDDLRLHNLDALSGPGLADPGRVLAPGSIAEADIRTGRDNLRLVAASSTASGVLDDTARVPFYLAGRFDSGRMRLFDIGAARDHAIEMDEALDLVLDLRFLGRPAANADFGLRAEPSAFFNSARSTVGTALPIVIPFDARSSHAQLHVNTATRVTTRYVITGPGDASTPTAPVLASLSFSDESLPDAPLLLAVDLVRSELRRNVFFDDARLALARGDATVPTSAASTHMRHCEDEDCNHRRYRVYLQLGPYTGDDAVVLRTVPSDLSDRHAARRARCAAGLADPVDRAAPYLVANVLRSPAPAPGMPAYNDRDARYALGNDGVQLHLVLSDDGVSPDRAPLLEGVPETVLYDEVGIAALRFSILCSDDVDYADPRALAVCGTNGGGCAREQDAPLIVRGPTLVYRFALARDDANPLFISDPVLALREPDAPAADPLPERHGELDFPERNAPSMGAELHVYATLASGPTPGSGLHNPLAVADTNPAGTVAARALSALGTDGAHALCVPRGQDRVQNDSGNEPGDAVIGDCALLRAGIPELGPARPLAYAGLVRVLDDRRWEPIAADELSQVVYPGQRGYYIPGDGLAALPAPTRARWLEAPQPPSLSLSSDDEPLLPGGSAVAARLSAVAYPARLYIRDAEATLSLSFDDISTFINGVAQLDRNAQTAPGHALRMRLHIGVELDSNELPLGLSAPGTTTTFRLPPVVPGCRTLRRSTVGDYHHPLQLMVSRRASDGTARDPRNFLDDDALSAAFSLNHTGQDQGQPTCLTPYRDSVHGHQLPAARYEGLLSNPLYYHLTLGPGSVPPPDDPNATADYVFTLVPRTEIPDRTRAYGPGNSAADALYRLYDTPDGSYPRTMHIRMGDVRPPVVCAGAVLDTHSVDEVRASPRDCLATRALAAYVMHASWTLAVDDRVESDAITAVDTFVVLDGPLPTPVSPGTSPPLTVSVLSTMSPYGLHYYTPGSNADPCAVPTASTLPSAYHHHLALPVDAGGATPLRHTLEAGAGMRPGRKHCIVLSARDGLYASYSEAATLTLPPYRPTRDRNDNAIPDDAELSRYPVPGDTTDSTVSGDAFGRAYCNELGSATHDPALGGRNDCDGDGVPDLVELAFDIPGHTRPRDEGRVRSAMCFATHPRTRLPLPTDVRLNCTGDGVALLTRLDGQWRIVLDDTRYRGFDYTLGAATADDAPGQSAGGLLPTSYWLVNPDFTQLLHLMLLPRVVLDVAPRVPVYTRYDYVDGGQVLHPDLVGRPSAEQRFTRRGESYRGLGSSSTLFYAVGEHSLDADRARSLPQEIGMRLFGATTAADDFSYRVELLSGASFVPLSTETRVHSGAVGAQRALITDLALATASPVRLEEGAHVLSVVLRARTGRLVLEQGLKAHVDGVLAAHDALPARLVAIGDSPTDPANPFPYGDPPRIALHLSDVFYATANTPRHAPLAHFSVHDDPSRTLSVLNVDAVASTVLERARVEWHVLDYATGRETLLATQLLRGIPDSTVPVSWPDARPISTNDLCIALGGCDFDTDPDAFHLFQLRATLLSTAYVETETELPPGGTYAYTHNQDGATVTEAGHTLSGAVRVVYERRLPAPVALAHVTQMVQLGGTLPGERITVAHYGDDDHDGVIERNHEAHTSRLAFTVGRSDTPAASLYGTIETPLRFARVHLGAYGRAGHQRLDAAGPLPLHGANIARLEDVDGDRPRYPARGGNARSDFALDFSIGCDTRAERPRESHFDGAGSAVGSSRSLSVESNCLGALTPVLLSFPAGAIPRGVLPAQIVALSTSPSRGYERAPTRLCEFVPGGAVLPRGLQDARARNNCPALVTTDNRSLDSGDSFAFAELDRDGACPDAHGYGQWPRINRPASGDERCLRLLISDNGPNDMAPAAEVITSVLAWSSAPGFDAFGIGQLSDASEPVGSTDAGSTGSGGSGGGAIDPWSVLALLVLAALCGIHPRGPAARSQGY